jgi:hypothetical protein
MSWTQIVVSVIGVFVGVVVVVAGIGYGLHAWWSHRRLVRCRRDELRREVAVIRARQHRELGDEPEPGLTSGGVPAVAPDRQGHRIPSAIGESTWATNQANSQPGQANGSSRTRPSCGPCWSRPSWPTPIPGATPPTTS